MQTAECRSADNGCGRTWHGEHAHFGYACRDPFDHLLIAQAIAEDAVVVSEDRNAALYPVRLLH